MRERLNNPVILSGYNLCSIILAKKTYVITLLLNNMYKPTKNIMNFL